MASFASLSREERLGLGVAAVAHVALVAALVWQVRDDPTPLPIPERMDVSLADEVSLESTAPDPALEQASVAPDLAPEPVRPVEAAPEITRPVTAPRPAARQTPQPRRTTAPTPSPSPTSARGSRLGDDFLEGAGGTERNERSGTPASNVGPQVRASLAQAVLRQVQPRWQGRVPQGVNTEKIVTILSIELNRDGTLASRPEVVRQEGVDASNQAQAGRHAEEAIRAVQLAAPFKLPPELYDSWKKLPPLRFRKST